MKKILFLICLFPLFVSGQNSYKFFIFFKNKNNSPYSLNTPNAFLSQRAIDRRLRQNIPLDSLDLPVNPQYLTAIENLAIPVSAKSKWFNGAVVYCDSAQLTQLLNLPFVQTARKVTRASGRVDSKFETPNRNARFSVPVRTDAIDYGAAANQIQMIKGDALHNAGFTGSGMVIAMLDAGYLNANQLSFFQDLYARNGVLGTWDFVENDSMVYEDDPHGEACMSTIAANTPTQMVGTAPDASFYLLRTEDANTEFIVEEYNWSAGAEYADSAGADIISSSLGYTEFQDTAQNHTYADMDGHTNPASIAANIAFSRGMLAVVSAGNEGQQPWHYISSPGDADSALTVGAVDFSGMFAAFSSYGPSADGDVKPNVVTQGLLAAIVDPFGGVSAASGTSFSCPILAGAAACLWQRFPDKTNSEIKNAIEQSASLFLTPNDSMGYGIPNFETAGFYLAATDPQLNQSDLLSTWPNPFSTFFSANIFSAKSTSAMMEIYSLIGEKLFSKVIALQPKNISTVPVYELQDFAKGVYLLKVKTTSKEFTLRLIKQ